jgi:Bifunctional DNA primase/polymerase, N-terminal
MEGFASVASELLEAGWYPLPLPRGAKSPPPAGFTGTRGRFPTAADVAYWSAAHPLGNTAVRPPAVAVGLDVDAYDGRAGARTLAVWEARYGALPPTVRTTSRSDGVSGIRFFRVPALTFISQLVAEIDGVAESNVEIVQACHRYALVHPTCTRT